MRKLNEHTVSIYSNFTQILVFGAIVLALGQDIGLFMDFNWVESIVLVCCGLFLVICQVISFMATQNLPLPARLPLNVTGVLFQIVIDTILFEMHFSALQLVFIMAVVCVKIYELSYFYCVEIP